MGYGKHFQDMYTGSMFGNSTEVFAVWGYVIAHMRVTEGVAHVELNPDLMAGIFATTADVIMGAIEFLEKPDPKSRSSDDDGSRLVLESERHGGPMRFRVVNGYKYRYTKDEEERKRKAAKRQAKYMAKQKGGQEWDGEGEDRVLAEQRPVRREFGQ